MISDPSALKTEAIKIHKKETAQANKVRKVIIEAGFSSLDIVLEPTSIPPHGSFLFGSGMQHAGLADGRMEVYVGSQILTRIGANCASAWVGLRKV